MESYRKNMIQDMILSGLVDHFGVLTGWQHVMIPISLTQSYSLQYTSSLVGASVPGVKFDMTVSSER
jgi:hypothetical protein